jgi:uncharacterized protein YndB with AHSA1/START domain
VIALRLIVTVSPPVFDAAGRGSSEILDGESSDFAECNGWTRTHAERRLSGMVRQNSRTRPETLERSAAASPPAIGMVAREVSHGRTTIILTWDFRQGSANVWSLLTRADRLQLWAPYTADRDLSKVGHVVLSMLVGGNAPDIEVPSVVLVADAPHVLEHSWAADLLAWRLTPRGSGCRLTLHQTLADATMASANAAGWHLCMGVAAGVLRGEAITPVRGMEAMNHGWAELNDAYAVALGVAPTRLG